MKEAFKEGELPLNELRRLGLVDGDTLNLNQDDKQALLAGRRTDFVKLKNLSSDGITIDSLDAKLSLVRNESNKVDVLIHPIYKEAHQHALLTEVEAEKLIKGELSHIEKDFKDHGVEKKHIIEYDSETREFLSYDPADVIPPYSINSKKLRNDQIEAFQKGEMIQLEDGTSIQHRAGEKKGVLSDRSALTLSVLLDGGVSYLLLRGINSFTGKDILKRDSGEKGEFELAKDPKVSVSENLESKQYSRGYTRTSSR
ncbi:DUF4099 domain-containing protein [Desertivirga xinjiangensis]|uniref:DUF4099 domain-containing protein n=1 Tax=Desertivirga xinjiangensis TaxID=539206 RepID=UPI00210E593D|nr:DUF4099 domain-containing protein [Pedobacter xinjiangensis]